MQILIKDSWEREREQKRETNPETSLNNRGQTDAHQREVGGGGKQVKGMEEGTCVKHRVTYGNLKLI